MLPALQKIKYKIKMIFISILSCFPVQMHKMKQNEDEKSCLVFLRK